jgi:hypothetical protein
MDIEGHLVRRTFFMDKGRIFGNDIFVGRRYLPAWVIVSTSLLRIHLNRLGSFRLC